MNDVVIALDLGSSKAVAVAARAASDASVEIVGIAEIPNKGMKRGVIADIDDTARTADQVLRKLLDETGIELGPVVVSIAGAHVEGTNSPGFKPIYPRNRTITHQDVMEVVNHSRAILFPPDREQIQAIPREFRIDGHRNIQRPVGMSGGKLEVVTYLVSGQTAQIQNLERVLTLTGKELDQIVLAPLAAGISVLTPVELESGTAVVDIGAGTTDLAIFTNGSIAYSISLPVGSGLVTSDISKLLKTSPDEAESLKLQFGAAVAKSVPEKDSIEVRQLGQPLARPMQRRVFAEIIESRMREIATMVAQQIEKAGFKGLLPGGIVLTGGGARLDHTAELFADVCGGPVRTSEPELGGKDQPAGLAVVIGLVQFVLQVKDDLSPVNGPATWQEKAKGLWSLLSRR